MLAKHGTGIICGRGSHSLRVVFDDRALLGVRRANTLVVGFVPERVSRSSVGRDEATESGSASGALPYPRRSNATHAPSAREISQRNRFFVFELFSSHEKVSERPVQI